MDRNLAEEGALLALLCSPLACWCGARCACQAAMAQWPPLVVCMLGPWSLPLLQKLNPNLDDISAQALCPGNGQTSSPLNPGDLVPGTVGKFTGDPQKSGLANHRLAHLEITSPPDCPIGVSHLASLGQVRDACPACAWPAARYTNGRNSLQMR